MFARSGEMTPQTKGITSAPFGSFRRRDRVPDHDALGADDDLLDHCA
jgi:hypothetical protein